MTKTQPQPHPLIENRAKFLLETEGEGVDVLDPMETRRILEYLAVSKGIYHQ